MSIRPGIFRRSIQITTVPGATCAEVEDDAHHYRATVRHDGTHVTDVEGEAIRTPWTLCQRSLEAIRQLRGMPLSPDTLGVYRHTDGSLQCTHLFDAAGLAVAHASRGTTARRYDIAVPVADATSPRTATLHRDGSLVLSWSIVDRTRITGPDPYTGLDLRTIVRWAESELGDPDDFEAITVLRRGWLVSGCRNFDLDDFPTASANVRAKLGACIVFQPGVAEHALRNRGTTLDFTDAPEKLLARARKCV